MRKRPLVAFVLLPLLSSSAGAAPRPRTELGGTWALSFDRTGSSCRVMLRAQKADSGAYFLGMPVACRHAMPALATVGRWSVPDGDHLILSDPAGAPVLALTRSGDAYRATTAAGRYRMSLIAKADAARAGFASLDADPAAAGSVGADPSGGAVVPVATRRRSAEPEPAERAAAVVGRYAVMRGKRDTGCMLTLDSAHVSGGSRAQLAPGCRDQGIVVFDPSTWQILKGELVLTARAGHKARLAKDGEGQWAKDAAEGGKPLGLKKL